MGRVVGIDFGRVRIGLAISDERRVIASALETIRAGKTHAQTAQLIVQGLSRYNNIDCVVIGLPLMMNGKEGEMALLVKAFAKVIEETLPYPVVLWDERLTSAGVEKMLLEADVSRKKRASLSDSLSAVAILQNYLDSLRR